MVSFFELVVRDHSKKHSVTAPPSAGHAHRYSSYTTLKDLTSVHRSSPSVDSAPARSKVDDKGQLEGFWSRGDLSVIDFTTVCFSHHGDRQFMVQSVVNDAVITHPGTSCCVLADKLLRAMRSGIIGQIVYSIEDPISIWPTQLTYLSRGRGGVLNAVRHVARSRRS